jgi:hypothetical protein
MMHEPVGQWAPVKTLPRPVGERRCRVRSNGLSSWMQRAQFWGLRASLLLGAITLAVATGGSPAEASSTMTLTGVVHCHGGAVEGIWVASSGPGSGWASRWNFSSGDTSDNTYSMTLAAGAYQVSFHVGCGGSPSNWATINISPNRPVSGSRTLNLFCGNGNRNGPCMYANWPGGQRAGGNLGDPCQCTAYALSWWHGYTGFWPEWSGNAGQWSTAAPQYGWSVTTIPMRYSIIVFPGNPGHVGWVDALVRDANHNVIGIQIDEGNVNGKGDCNSVLTNENVYFASPPSRFGPTSGWRYIPAS